jgi:aerobic-type carbon monoxide dehydrogenase small subunit (CoxS/CutS family)
MTTFNLNGRTVSLHSPHDAPLLWVIRENWASQGPNSAAGLACVGPALCMWKGARLDPVSPRSTRWPELT